MDRGRPKGVFVLEDAFECKPTGKQVDQLILKAKKHPLGLKFLRDGHLLTVATTFETHAFIVEAARRKLKRKKRSPIKKIPSKRTSQPPSLI